MNKNKLNQNEFIEYASKLDIQKLEELEIQFSEKLQDILEHHEDEYLIYEIDLILRILNDLIQAKYNDKEVFPSFRKNINIEYEEQISNTLLIQDEKELKIMLNDNKKYIKMIQNNLENGKIDQELYENMVRLYINDIKKIKKVLQLKNINGDN